MASMWDILSTILGIVGVLAIFPLIGGAIHFVLPNTRLKALHGAVEETESYLSQLQRQGFLRETHISMYEEALQRLRYEVEPLRTETYLFATLWDQIKGIFNGLSKKLFDLHSRVTKLRAEISTTAKEEMARSSAEGDASQDLSNSCPDTVGAPTSMTPTSVQDTPVNQSLGSFESIPSSPFITDANSPHSVSSSYVPIPPTRPTPGRHSCKQLKLRTKRYLATRRCDIVTMEHRKSGLIRDGDFRLALRARTMDSVLSSPTCVPSTRSDTLPMYMTPNNGSHGGGTQNPSRSPWRWFSRRLHLPLGAGSDTSFQASPLRLFASSSRESA